MNNATETLSGHYYERGKIDGETAYLLYREPEAEPLPVRLCTAHPTPIEYAVRTGNPKHDCPFCNALWESRGDLKAARDREDAAERMMQKAMATHYDPDAQARRQQEQAQFERFLKGCFVGFAYFVAALLLAMALGPIGLNAFAIQQAERAAADPMSAARYPKFEEGSAYVR
jgi:Zn-finger nucleic acid-binding protein